jgi:phosphohistidine phosphatase
MRTIYLVRHGKAEGRNIEMDDYDRPLAERGIDDSITVSSRLAQYGIRPSVIISSPAPRAIGTAKIFAKQFHYPVKKIRTRISLYEQNETAIAEIVTGLDNAYDSVMVVGHNPLIEECARFLTGNLKNAVPTCGVVGIECQAERWKDIQPGNGKVVFFEAPVRAPKPLTSKFMRKTVERRLADSTLNVLTLIDADAAGKTVKNAGKSVAETAGEFVKRVMKKRTKSRKKTAKNDAAEESQS